MKEKVPFLKLLLQPFKNTNFKNLMMFMGPWNFAANLAGPFFTVYMLNRLQLSMSFVIALSIISQITMLAFLKIWGKYTDRFSNKSVLGVSGPMFMLCIFAWAFTTLPEKYFLTIPLLVLIHIFMGMSTAGVNLATGNIGLKLAPKGEATAYLAANNLINSVAAGIAPIVGGTFADFFAGRELAWTMTWKSLGKEYVLQALNFQHWDFFFFFAFVIGCYSIHRLSMIQEVGEVEERVVFNELILETLRPLRNFSSVGGLRYMIQFPLSMVKQVNRIVTLKI